MVEAGRLGDVDEADLVYAPEGDAGRLDRDALANALLGLSHADYDFVLFSRSLHELPRVVAPRQLRQSVVFTASAIPFFLHGELPAQGLRGRLVRNPGLRDGSSEQRLEDLFTPQPVRTEGVDIIIGTGPGTGVPVRDWSAAHFQEPVAGSRPCVFVWPVLWAVGGVERVAVEVMQHLRDDYRFVVVTLERLSEAQGSLHHALKGLAEVTYDLGEIASAESHLSMLASLKHVYRPELVWICNGSPWQCDNASRIREIYADTPIVDQEAYDARVGWITRYHEPGIQSFDRHVAVNQAVRAVLLERLGMDPDRVDLIYPAFDSARFEPSRYPRGRVRSIRRELDIPDGASVFVFVGRMTAQKRPLDFVTLASAFDPDDGLHFLMLGDGDLAPIVDRQIEAHGAPTIRRLSFSDQVPDLLAVADGLVITSEYEGLPVAMLEALAMGVPVLATDVGDIRIVLGEYGAGLIVPRIGDHEVLSDAFSRFLRELPRLREAARSASARVRERFSGAATAARYNASWRKALQAGPRATRS